MESQSKGLPPFAWFALGLAYFICPLDFDFVPVAGWVDDWVIVYMAYKKWKSEAAIQAEAHEQALMQA